MNNGNLLNSLLGATGVNSAAGKTSSVKHRPETGVDSSEKFRDALEQARPEVAAPKSVAHKPSPQMARKPESRPTVADSRAEVPRDTNVGANRKTEPPPVDKKSAEPQGKVESHQSDVEKTVVEMKPVEDVVVADNKSELQVAESAEENVTEAASVLVLLDPESLAGADKAIIAGARAIEMEEEVDGANSEEGTLALAEAVIASTTDPLLANPLTVPAPEPEANLSVTTDIEAPEPEFAVGPDGVELQVANVLTSVSTTAARTDAATTGTASGTATNPLAALVNQLGKESGANDSLVTVAGDTPADVDAIDNPDLFILSGKAAFSKLMDTSVSADKATPIVDTAKPTLTATSLAEPLVRLSEAQSPSARSFVVQTGLPVTVGQPQWSQAVGEKVLWLAAQNVSSAEIRLDPPDLGTMHVKVSVNQDQASVSFTSPHPVVREALDQQLNRLREMFSEQGLNLVNVDVSDKSFAQQRDDGQGDSRGAANEADDEELMPVATSTIVSTRLVDHYA